MSGIAIHRIGNFIVFAVVLAIFTMLGGDMVPACLGIIFAKLVDIEIAILYRKQ